MFIICVEYADSVILYSQRPTDVAKVLKLPPAIKFAV